ncbi:Beta-galactosidase C-terminal domain [Paenibacillus vietnamensis]|uniref:Beta-galactosidase C-terminal domain n=1 Tax=Paenibacillus vietnamensis TaxID=2590547 RepID=UPI002964E9A7|nr:Beta-galactosidase C-terminal domain [Paenibacillus vietnamensis]
MAEEGFYTELFRDAAEEAGVGCFAGLPDGVQISIREKGDSRFLFITNLSRQRNTVPLGGPFYGLLAEATVGPDLDMEPYGVEIVVWAQ